MNIAHINELEEIQTVEQHCKETGQIARKMGEELGIGNLAYLAGILHDCGKETEAFSTYIKEKHSGTSTQRRGDINHSSAGAKYLYELIHPENGLGKLTCQLVAYAIAAHHGLFDIITVEGIDYFEKRIHPEKGIYYQEAIDNYQQYISKDFLQEVFDKSVNEIQRISQKMKLIITEYIKRKKARQEIEVLNQFLWGSMQRYLLSIVIDADRENTNQFMSMRRIEAQCDTECLWTSYAKNLEKYISQLPSTSKIAILRGKISKECLEFASNETGIYRLSCPTGGGKTLASFRYALAHAKEYHKKHIVYVAPYRAILEQNCEVIKKVFGDSKYILEHHSDVIPDDNETYQYLTQRWTSPILFTTMVQFLNTLFSNRTQSIRRFHNLSNSVIIIDETQSIPVKCIHMFNMMLNFLSYCCNSTIILCTATQPALENVKYPVILRSPYEMVNDAKEKYTAFKRVNVVDQRIPTGYNASQLAHLIIKKLESVSTILVIVNTKDAAKECYNKCKDFVEQTGNDILLYHLSTNMCPQHRIDRLSEMKEKIVDRKIICISTQLIEAGVDISFQCVIRSFAGLDSIAQAAGRCNRNGTEECKEVLVVNYIEEKIERLIDIQLGQQATGLILDSYKIAPQIFEGDLLSIAAMDKFYERYYFSRVDQMNYSVPELNTSVLDMMTVNRKGYMELEEESVWMKYPLKQAYDTAGKSFEVIDSKTVGILVPYEQGVELINELNGKADQKRLDEKLRLVQRYTVNVFQYTLKRLEEQQAIYELEIGGIYALKDGFYNEVTGMQLEGYFDFLIQ